MSNFANRDSLPDGLYSGIVGLQRQIMREQDEGLGKSEETVISTKHIALAVNEELTLHTRLINDLDEHVDVTDSRLKDDLDEHVDVTDSRLKVTLSLINLGDTSINVITINQSFQVL
ncbi:syntaxin-52-like protein isoform X3, partial [Tanacetum coccineum]